MSEKTILDIDHYAQHKVGTPEYIVALAQYQKSNNLPFNLYFRGKKDKEAYRLASAVIAQEKLQQTDPIATAEEVTGISYKNKEEGGDITTAIGLEYMIEISADKKRLSDITDDSTFVTDTNSYIRIIESEGFEKVLEIPFKRKTQGAEKAVEERYFIFFHRENAILLSFDTYGLNVNGGKFWYNIVPNSEDFWRYTSSGGYDEVNGVEFWSGDHDCREGIRLAIARLRENGTFLKKWKKLPHLWLMHHGENSPSHDSAFDYDQLTNQKIIQLPDYVKQAIMPALEDLFFGHTKNKKRNGIQEELLKTLIENGFVSKIKFRDKNSKIMTVVTDFYICEYWEGHSGLGDDYCRGRARIIESKSFFGIFTKYKTDDKCTQTAEFSIMQVVGFEK